MYCHLHSCLYTQCGCSKNNAADSDLINKMYEANVQIRDEFSEFIDVFKDKILQIVNDQNYNNVLGSIEALRLDNTDLVNSVNTKIARAISLAEESITIANTAKTDANLDVTAGPYKNLVQKDLNEAHSKNIYYSDLLGFKTSKEFPGFDNSSVWSSIKNTLKSGDTLIFRPGVYNFNSPIDIRTSIKIYGTGKNWAEGTELHFPRVTDGIQVMYPHVHLQDLLITGTPSNATPDIKTGALGSVGLKLLKYKESADYPKRYTLNPNSLDLGSNNFSSSGLVIRNFDVGISSILEGDYTKVSSKKIFINSEISNNKIGIVFTGSETANVFLGTHLINNNLYGIYVSGAHCFVDFIGLLLSTNGVNPQGLGASLNRSSSCAVLATEGALVSLKDVNTYKTTIVSTNKAVININNILFEPGRMYMFSYNAVILVNGSSAGNSYPVKRVYGINSYLYAYSNGVSQLVDTNNTTNAVMRVHPTVDSPSTAWQFLDTDLQQEDINVADINCIKIKLKYKVSSGVPDNLALKFTSYVKTSEETYSIAALAAETRILEDTQGEYVSSEFYLPISANAKGTLKGFKVMGGFVDHNEENTQVPLNSDFTITFNKFDFEIFSLKDLEVLPVYLNRGSLSYRPKALTEFEKGYRFYNTSSKVELFWSGTSWVTEDVYYGRTSVSNTTNLKNKANQLNVFGKQAGTLCLNKTDNNVYIASDAAADSDWISVSDPSTVITPV